MASRNHDEISGGALARPVSGLARSAQVRGGLLKRGPRFLAVRHLLVRNDHAHEIRRLGEALEILAQRRLAMDAKGEAGWQPAAARARVVSQSLAAYGLMATSAARGAVRDISQLKRR